MPSSTHVHKFLLDENVRIELFRFLKQRNFNVKKAPKSAPDNCLLVISKREKRILVTNDEDFIELTSNEVFSVVWLRIPQNDPKRLVETFEKLTNDVIDFSGKLFILRPRTWEEFPLTEQTVA